MKQLENYFPVFVLVFELKWHEKKITKWLFVCCLMPNFVYFFGKKKMREKSLPETTETIKGEPGNF